MKLLVIGLGVQGRKRAAIAREDVVATVDPVVPEATHRHIEGVPLDVFDAACVCTPDQIKFDLVRYLLRHGKHVLVEKPLIAHDLDQLHGVARLAQTTGAACYTAYNHRFEPHIARLKTLLETETIGPAYLARCLYGNGTAAEVNRSPWRDQGSGVLADLGSHLLDLSLFLFGASDRRFELWSANRFENQAFDHVLFGSRGGPALELEGSLISWRNTFTLDVYGPRGSAHIHGLCKWGPSLLTIRQRVLPSGRPTEEVSQVACADPTWALEYDHFKRLCRTGGTNLANDLWIASALNELTGAVNQEAVP